MFAMLHTAIKVMNFNFGCSRNEETNALCDGSRQKMKDSFAVLHKTEGGKKKLANYKFYTICAVFGQVLVNGCTWIS